MRLSSVRRIIGLLVTIFSISMLPPYLVAVFYGDGESRAFGLSFILILLIGIAIWRPKRNRQFDLRLRDGFLVVALFWVVLGLLGALPFLFARSISLSPTDAIFESISGLTTTGATVMSGLDALPHAILFYRQQLQWFGGMGIIVLAVAVLPMLGVGGMQLYRAETPGPVKDNKLTPRITETAKALWLIYLILTVVCASAYFLAGMDLFDAICHSFSTVSIGGFSPHDASIGYFDSRAIEWICILFMFIAGINFSLHFVSWRQMSVMQYFKDPEFNAYVVVLSGLIVLVSLHLWWSSGGHYNFETLTDSFFQSVSIGTTTGFSTAEFAAWPGALPAMLILASFIGGCAGSTGGGMKVIRWLLIFKQGARELVRLVHPNAVIPVRLGQRAVSEQIVQSVWGFFSVYVIIFGAMMLLLMALGSDQVTAFSAMAASLNNLGPGLGDVAANYADLNSPSKWIAVLAMLLGRLEIFTLFVLITPAFWRR